MVQHADGSQTFRWVQTVFVLRGDAIAAHSTDYGPAGDFADVTPLLLMMDGDEDTVGLAWDYAEKNRHDAYWQQRAKEQQAESTLIRDHMEQIEMLRQFARRNHRTVKELK